MIIQPFIKKYIILALRIERISDGYVDAYYGPSEIKEMVFNEPLKSIKELIRNTKDLKKELPNQINNTQRQVYLGAILNAIETFLNILNGDDRDFIEQVETILGVKPDLFQEKLFYDLQEQYKLAFLGDGSLNERMEFYRGLRYIPINEIIPKFKRALEITHDRTNILFPGLLPKSDSFEIKFANKRVGWSFRNEYKGNFHSLFIINPFQPMYWTTFLPTAAHEGYPGHHTEFSVKNDILFNQLNYPEYCVILVNNPNGVVIEGIAETAPFMLFSPEERIRIELNEFCRDPNEEDTIDTIIKQNEVKFKLKKFKIHLANLANFEQWSEKELLKYANDFGFFPKANLESFIRFILDPKYKIIQYTYNYGIELITKKFGFPPKLDDFKYLLSNPVLSWDLI